MSLKRLLTYIALLVSSLPLLASAAVGVGFRGGVYRGPASAAVGDVLIISSRDVSTLDRLKAVELTLPAGKSPLTSQWVLQQLHKKVPDITFTWFGPAKLRRATQLQHVDKQVVVDAARAALEGKLQGQFSNIAINPVSKPETMVVKPGVLSVQASVPEDEQVRSRMMVSVDVYVDKGKVANTAVWFAVHAEAQIPVYSENMPAEHEIGEDDIRMESRDVSRLWGVPVQDIESLRGKWLTRPVQSGQPVLLKDFAKEPLIRHDQRVEIRVVSGPLVIVAPGVAEESGNKGDLISVRVDEAEGSCEGRIVQKGVVQVGY